MARSKEQRGARAQIQARLADEVGTLRSGAAERVALLYPSPYHVGMSSLGFQAIYGVLHDAGYGADRAFLPDDLEDHRRSRQAFVTYETERPVGEYRVIGVSVAYELELTGLFDCLELAGLPVLAADRDERHPFILAGGPLTFSNPLPLGPFVDAVILGEAEVVVRDAMAILFASPSRDQALTALGRLPGVWIPSRDGERLPPVAQIDDELLPARSRIVTPNTELRSMFLIEPERGCSRGCTYCVMRRSTNGGMRIVPQERVLGAIPARCAARRAGRRRGDRSPARSRPSCAGSSMAVARSGSPRCARIASPTSSSACSRAAAIGRSPPRRTAPPSACARRSSARPRRSTC